MNTKDHALHQHTEQLFVFFLCQIFQFLVSGDLVYSHRVHEPDGTKVHRGMHKETLRISTL